MKPRLRWKWLPIQPRPDPEYGLPVPRSAHGLSFLRHRNSFVIYGGEGSGSNLGEHQQCWECYLGDFTLSSAAFTPQSFPSARNHQVPQWRRIDFLATNPPTFPRSASDPPPPSRTIATSTSLVAARVPRARSLTTSGGSIPPTGSGSASA
jgi:hypothetical protein